MNGSQLKSALREGKRVYGTLVVSTSPHWPSAVEKTGVDFVFIDTEHIAIDRTSLAWMCQTYKALGIAPIVRIPEPDPFLAVMAVDGGASGVIAPYIETPQQVKKLYGAVKLRPVKGAVLDNRLNGSRELPGETADYVENRNAENVLILNIESTPALDALDEILKQPGIDAVQVGPHDLSCSLGLPEQYRHPLFLERIEYIIRTARRRHIGIGIHFWEGLDQEIEWAKLGANLIVHSGDIVLFTQTLRSDIATIRKALGERVLDAFGSEVTI
jgi:2-keto-3-deoxy-L-rhamnonate aldolase RhmA